MGYTEVALEVVEKTVHKHLVHSGALSLIHVHYARESFSVVTHSSFQPKKSGQRIVFSGYPFCFACLNFLVESRSRERGRNKKDNQLIKK